MGTQTGCIVKWQYYMSCIVFAALYGQCVVGKFDVIYVESGVIDLFRMTITYGTFSISAVLCKLELLYYT